jgi:protein arginine kinase activator
MVRSAAASVSPLRPVAGGSSKKPMREKCMRCSKPASYHITDIESGKAREFHFCDEHARQHLAGSEKAAPDGPTAGDSSPIFIGDAVAGHEPVGADHLTCPVCQVSFKEFRDSGRLGCPHDYEVFRDELMPLLEKIHDDTRHAGKSPKRAPQNTERQTALIEKRNLLKRAVTAEDYETAAQLRDEIKNLERDAGH